MAPEAIAQLVITLMGAVPQAVSLYNGVKTSLSAETQAQVNAAIASAKASALTDAEIAIEDLNAAAAKS